MATITHTIAHNITHDIAQSFDAIYQPDELPGGMSHIVLHHAGAINASARKTLYRSSDGLSPWRRAELVRPLLPYGITVCLWLAAWIWVGGEFPEALDVVASTRYMSDAYNRALRLHNRTVNGRDLVILRRLRVSSPLRTACDIACLDDADVESHATQRATVATLMRECALAPQTCIHALQNNPHTMGHPEGVRLFRDMRDEEERLRHIIHDRAKEPPLPSMPTLHPAVMVPAHASLHDKEQGTAHAIQWSEAQEERWPNTR